MFTVMVNTTATLRQGRKMFFDENELYDDGYEGVEQDDRDGLYYEYEYGSLLDQVEEWEYGYENEGNIF